VRLVRSIPVALAAATIIAGCNTETQQKLATVSHADSVHVDSLSKTRKDLMDEVMASTQFVTDINRELSKARSLLSKQEPQLETSNEMTATNEQRKLIVARITHLVARLDSVQNRLATARSRVTQLTKQDSALVQQVAAYEKSIADLQASAQKEREDLQTVITRQTGEIATLNGKVDTLTNVKVALTDTVNQLTTQKNTVYYVVGTRDELIQKGVLVAEGGKRFVVLGGRHIVPARTLDPAAFSKIDRLTDRTIKLPEGEYEIMSRQNVSFAKAQAAKDGKISGSLTIEQPEQFWATSPFLIIVRS
jgi:predicted  nucleic acid-binding Zn-ribbon protein